MDSAEPSTNGISAQNLYRLSSMLEDEEYESYARQTCQAFEAEIMQHPFLFSSLLPAVVAGALGMKSVVAVGEADEVEEAVRKMKAKLGGLSTVTRWKPGGWLEQRNRLVGSLKGARPRLVVCEGGVCREEGGLDMKELERAVGGIR